MSTLTALARAQAYAADRAVPLATVRHLHVHRRPKRCLIDLRIIDLHVNTDLFALMENA